MAIIKYNIFFALLIFVCCHSFAQNPVSKKSFQFHSINQLGLLEGQTGGAFQLQTVNGFQYRSVFAGLGLGLDGYRFRGIPAFIDLRKEFGRSADKFFVYADGGIHYNWLTDAQKSNAFTGAGGSVKFSNGLYLDAGIGYKINFNRKNSLLLSAGYSYKHIKEIQNNYFIIPPPLGVYPIYDEPYQTFIYDLNRLSIKIGWEF